MRPPVTEASKSLAENEHVSLVRPQRFAVLQEHELGTPRLVTGRAMLQGIGVAVDGLLFVIEPSSLDLLRIEFLFERGAVEGW